ncbi:MAG TPA: hypothetical protein VI462_17355 [Acidimicrobiia bacterium]
MRGAARGFAAALLGGLTGVGVLGVSFAATSGLPLPHSIPGRHERLVAEALARGQLGPIDNHAPGPVTVSEAVALGVRPDGSSGPVTVHQRVVIDGTGDFTIELPMEAADVLPANETSQPGLRQGTVLWEGFAPGRRELDADVTLLGRAAAQRMPVAVTSTTRAHEVTVSIADSTAVSVITPTGAPTPASLSQAIDAARAVIAAGGLPVAGEAGVPASLTPVGDVASVAQVVNVPVRVTGEIAFGGVPQGVDSVVAESSADDALVLHGSGPVAMHLTVQLVAPTLADLPSLPPDAGPAAARAALDELDLVLLRSLVVMDYAPFVPGVGTASTAATFSVAPAPALHAMLSTPTRHADVLVIVAFGIALVLIVAAGGVVWARH